MQRYPKPTADERPDDGPGMGLYVHVPFCTVKCGYCDFYSHANTPDAFAPLIDALLVELDQATASNSSRVETIFVGGGTPTVLPPPLLDRLIQRLGAISRRDNAVEFTVEANPATVDDEKAAILASAGVDRVSMGAQSFNTAELRMLDRTHQPADVAASMKILQRAGLTRFNLDLIFGIPGQTLESWLASLHAAIDLEAEHLSCYGLTYEPDTPLRRSLDAGHTTPLDEDLEARMYLAAIDTLSAAGYRQYEISNHAMPNRECRHNLRYWYNLPGIGMGPAAASYVDGRRWRNLPDTAEYIRRIRRGESPAIDLEHLSSLRRAGETAMLALRLNEGIQRERFHQTTGYDPFDLFARQIREHTSAGLLRVDHDRIALTRRGLLLADAVIGDFVRPAEPVNDGSKPPRRSASP